jgi:CheY-like chemotaxis protein
MSVPAERRPRPRTVLLVEDDDVLRPTLVEMLIRDGWRVIAVGDGAAALEALDEERPDAILSDRVMPRMSGFELLRAIRRDRPALDDVPFVFLTVLDDPRDMAAIASLAPAAYLTKPVQARALNETLAALLGGGGRPIAPRPPERTGPPAVRAL